LTHVGYVSRFVISLYRSVRDTKANFYTSVSAVEPWNNKAIYLESLYVTY